VIHLETIKSLSTTLHQKYKDLSVTKKCSRAHLGIFHQIKMDSIDEISDHLKKNSKKGFGGGERFSMRGI